MMMVCVHALPFFFSLVWFGFIWFRLVSFGFVWFRLIRFFCFCFAGDGAGEAFMKKYVAQPRIPEHARYGKAKEMVEKKVMLQYYFYF